MEIIENWREKNEPLIRAHPVANTYNGERGDRQMMSS